MANAEHLAILKEGVEVWNDWRKKNPNIEPDLSEALLFDMNLQIDIYSADISREKPAYTEEGMLVRENEFKDKDGNIEIMYLIVKSTAGLNLCDANLERTKFMNSRLKEANFSRSYLREANFSNAYLHGAKFKKADLEGVCFDYANCAHADFGDTYIRKPFFSFTNLSNANFQGAFIDRGFMNGALLVESNFNFAKIEETWVYGTSIWNIKKDGLVQKNLIITPPGESKITVDDLEIAQFIYLLLKNEKFRNVIETVTSKAVLILGRFTDQRKKVLDAIRDELRNRNFLPILFDFEKPATRDLTETISILAKLSRFVIADLTDAKSIPQELSHIVPNMPSLPVIPLILKGQREYGMFEHWPRYPWVLPIYEYENEGHLIATLSAGVIEQAERKVQEIRGK